MEMLENKQPRKRRLPKAARIVLAAALVVGCVLSIAAGLPKQVYNFMSGGSVTFIGNDDRLPIAEWTPRDENFTPIVLEDGKLWFVNGEERTDLTGLINEDTPYIYEHTDLTNGTKGYVIVGGTVDDFGWAEYFEMEGGFGTWDGVNYAQEDVNHPWFQAAMEELGVF